MKASVVAWAVWGMLTLGCLADRLTAGWRTYRAALRRPTARAVRPPASAPILSDRGWKEQVYGGGASAPSGPDPTTVIYQQWLRETPLPSTGLPYEQALLARFTTAGWQVALTPRSGDYGADLVGTDPQGRRWVIQAKDWQKPVGVHAVQEVFAAQGYYQARGALVVSTHGFTPPAQRLAQRLGVQLITLMNV